MRILLDACVWGGVRTILEVDGHDVEWAGDWEHDPGDEEILSFAFPENRICVTLDKDFGELAVVHNRPHCGILRLVDLRSDQQGPTCLRVLSRYGEELSQAPS